jgi:hypothetical protein
MLTIIAFEAAFWFLRQFLVHRLTTGLDVKLSAYVFEKVLNSLLIISSRLPSVSRDIREVFRICLFLIRQLFGTILIQRHLSSSACHVLLQSDHDIGAVGLIVVAYPDVANLPQGVIHANARGRRAAHF